MAGSIEEFISKFHSLDGTTIGEKRKNLFLLLKATKEQLGENHGALDLSSIDPQNPLEENFKLEALLYFRRTSELLDVLRGGHPILIEKTLTPWFLKEAFGKMSGDELMKLFLHLSYITKLKLLHKLSLHLNDAEKVDEFFLAVNGKYGMYLASQLICGCTKNLILDTIEENKIEVTAKQMLVICKKYPEEIETFFEKIDRHKSTLSIGNKYVVVFRYLAQHNTKLFMTLNEKYNSSFSLGNRATKTLIVRQKEAIVDEPKKYFNFLKTEVFGTELKNKLDAVYLKLFPLSLKELNNDLNKHFQLLKCLGSESAKLEMLQKTFKAKHGSELWDHPKFFTENLIRKMTPEERESWMENHTRPDDIPEEEWISFMKTEKSIPLLKNKMAFTASIKDRLKLVKALVLTCSINKDKEALLEVCKYVLGKHKNDHQSIRNAFTEGIEEVFINTFKVTDLNEEIWNVINEFIAISKLKGDDVWSMKNVSERYIEYRLEKGLPIDDQLKDYLKYSYVYYSLCTNGKYEKQILLKFNDIIPLVFKDDELKRNYVEYLGALQRWNQAHPKDRTSLFISEESMELVKNNLKTQTYVYDEQRVAEDCILREPERAAEENLPELLFQHQNFYFTRKLANFVVKKPHFLQKYLKEIFAAFFKGNGHQLFESNMFKYYSHLDIPQQIVDLSLEAMNTQRGNQLEHPTLALSKVMPADAFLNLALFNTDLQLDLDSEEGQKLYQKRVALLPRLKNVLPPSRALDTILKFSDKDYLHLVQSALQSVALNVPERELTTFFNTLSERTVSAKKHAIFLGFKVLDKDTSCNMLIESMEKETNPSVRKALFKGLFNFFLRNPDEYSWELVKKTAGTFEPQDKEAFENLSKCTRIPTKYFVPYAQFAWETLEKCEKIETKEESKSRILDVIDDKTVKDIPEEFFVKVQNDLFKSKKLTDFQKKVQGFICRYIIYSQEDKMESVFRILKKCVEESWYDVNHQEIRKIVSNFVKEFCGHFFEKTCTNKDLLGRFATFWENILQPHEAYQEYLHLKFTLIFIDALNEKRSISEIAQHVLDLWNSLQVQVEKIFLTCFEKVKEKLLTIDENDTETNEPIFIKSLATQGTADCLLLSILLLPKEEDVDERIKNDYKDIKGRAMKLKNPLLNVYLHDYLIREEHN